MIILKLQNKKISFRGWTQRKSPVCPVWELGIKKSERMGLF